MPSENVETVRRLTAAMGRGDLEAAAAELAPKMAIDDRDLPDADATWANEERSAAGAAPGAASRAPAAVIKGPR